MADTVFNPVLPEFVILGMQGKSRYYQAEGEAQEEGYLLHMDSGLTANLMTFSVV
jgi:hypothetical protein